MAITLSDDERVALCTAIDNYLPELRYELARIKLQRDRESLLALEHKLTQLRRRLEVAS
ncbi:MAG: hypothetical protein HY698_02900 [Deltaproteobacteria bacterium]|nr:hypothetical protein [Deltaproteobacteria bacterium]